MAEKVRDTSIALYEFAARHALERGIIIADTKFEFGLLDSGELILIDEMFTPDSSRFWPADSYQPGGSPPSFDKQYVRDYLESIKWNKEPPAPALPDDVVANTRRSTRRPCGAWCPERRPVLACGTGLQRGAGVRERRPLSGEEQPQLAAAEAEAAPLVEAGRRVGRVVLRGRHLQTVPALVDGDGRRPLQQAPARHPSPGRPDARTSPR